MKRAAPFSTDALATALSNALTAAPPKHAAMLRAHFRSRKQTTSATGLQKRVGYPNFNSVNLQYGLFAKRVKEELGVTTRSGIHLEVLVEFIDTGEQNNEHILWKLRPEVMAALRKMGWVA